MTTVPNGSEHETASQEYLDLLRTQHARQPSWGAHGFRNWKRVQYLHDTQGGTVLDYGCGKGTLAETLDFEIEEYDPGILGKEKATQCDVVCCLDVLEHVEPERLDTTLRHIKWCARKIAYFVIHCGPANAVLPDGRNAHLIQETGDWWRVQLEKHFRVLEFEDRGHEVEAVCDHGA